MHSLLLETYRRNQTFWGWTQDAWLEIIGESDDQFNQRYGVDDATENLLAIKGL